MNTRKMTQSVVGFFSLFFLILYTLDSAPVFARADLTGDMALLDRSSKAFVNVVKKAKRAVVHIKVEKTKKAGYSDDLQEMFGHPFFDQFFGPQFKHRRPQPREYVQEGQGSGFIISPEGYILTNNHVVGDADTIRVRLPDDREFKAEIVGTDPQSDVALIKIEDADNLPVLPLGDSSKLEVAEWVIAIGNPFGLSQTVTLGVVSATGRSGIGINDYENFIQTDAAINPGNSGGPLINSRGEAVGINTALFSKTGGYMGIGFAIPINMAKSIEQQLQKHGKVHRGWLGVVIQDVNKELARSFGLKEARGVLISEVQPDSPAEAAGIKRDDIIIRLNGEEIDDASDLRNKVALLRPESTASVSVLRDGKEKKIRVAIGQRPSDDDGRLGSSKIKSLQDYGLTLQELTRELAERFDYETDSGLIVSNVEPGSPAARAGLKPGQLVEEVNRKPVNSLADLKAAIGQSRDPGNILLRVRSGNYATYVVLESRD